MGIRSLSVSDMECKEENLTKKFSISDFKGFMGIPLSCTDTKPICGLYVFSGSESKANSKIKLKLALEHFDFISFPTLVQFWAPTQDQQQFLDTSDLPFGLNVLRKGLCSFRKRCLNYRYSIDTDGDGSGPPARVFQRRFPEFCPDVTCYSVEEYQLKGSAVDISVRGYLCLPVYEPDWQCCIGVLEILTIMDGSYCLTNLIQKVSDSLKKVGLRSSDIFWPFDTKQLAYNQLENAKGHPEYELALKEMQKVLEVLCKEHKLPFAQTWVVTLDESSGGSIMSTAKMGSYMSIKKVSPFQRDCISFHLRKGQGIVWKAFSCGTSCFCRDITQLSIVDYALVLSARRADLTGAFAICLQNIYTGTAVYIIELFLPPNQTIYRQPWIFLNSLLDTMKQQFETFNLSSGQEVGNELPVAVLKISEDDPLDSFIICQTTDAGEGLKNQRNKEQLTSCQPVIFEVGAKRCGLENAKIKENAASSSSMFECSQNAEVVQSHHTITQKNDATETLILGEPVSTKVLEKQSGKRRTNFPDDPSVNKSTSKNLSPVPNKNRCAMRKRSKVDCPFTEHKSMKEAKKHVVESGQQPESCYVSSLEEARSTFSSLSPVSTPMQNQGRIMTVKAEYEGDITKFQVPVASGIMILKDEVMKRLRLTVGTFEIKCHREDNIWIVLDSDAELQEYVSAIRSLGISTIKLFIVSIASRTEVKKNVEMTVKASYQDDLIKFQLSLSAGILELKNKIIYRLKLDDESFEIKYVDENNCQILLDTDAALQNCISKVTSLQKTTIKLSIQPTRSQPAMSNECIIMVKASYGDDIIKFHLSPSCGMMNLKDEVTKRLKLEAGSFVIKYLDGHNNEVLLDGNAALAKYVSTMTSMGIYTTKISIHPQEQ